MTTTPDSVIEQRKSQNILQKISLRTLAISIAVLMSACGPEPDGSNSQIPASSLTPPDYETNQSWETEMLQDAKNPALNRDESNSPVPGQAIANVQSRTGTAISEDSLKQIEIQDKAFIAGDTESAGMRK